MKPLRTAALCLTLCTTLLLSLTSCFLIRPLNKDPDKVYGQLIEEYTHLGEARLGGEDITTKSSPTVKGLSNALFDSLKTVIAEAEYKDVAELGYAFYDLDSDGIYECFLMKKDGTLYALYACKNGAPVLVENYTAENCAQGVLLEDGSIFTHKIIKKDGKTVASQYDYSFFTEGSMEAVRTYYVDYEADDAYALEYGVKRDFADKEIHHINSQANNYHYSYKTCAREAGLWFHSVTGEEEQPDALAFDASSYDALLNTLSTMMPAIRAFVYKDWLNGEYDQLMAVDSPEEFSLYSNLLYACGMHGGYTDAEGNVYRKALGYAYKDLNADGSDELFIMNEDSELIALFTLKDGIPVLLWRATDGAFSAIDSEGQFMAARYANRTYTAMEYFVYKLTPEGELTITEYLYGDEHVRKTTVDGQTTIVDYDTYRAEFKRIFDKNQGEIWDGAWNEGGKTLTFIPFA